MAKKQRKGPAPRDWLDLNPKKSRFWQLRLPYPTWYTDLWPNAKKVRQISSEKEIRAEARIWSLPYILDHLENLETMKQAAKETRPDIDFSDDRGTHANDVMIHEHRPELGPNEEKFLADGSRLKASKCGTFAVHYDAAGDLIDKIDIPKVHSLSFNGPGKRQVKIRKMRAELATATHSIDQAVFDYWAKDQTAERKKAAMNTLDLLHAVAPNRSFVTLTPKDVRSFVQRMVDDGQSTTSMIKKVGGLNAMINRAIGHEDFRQLKSNPFKLKDLIPKGIAGRRTPPTLFTEIELTRIHADLPNWDHEPRLLFSMLYFMGARLGEPFHVKGEETIEGQRCVSYGTKTAASTDRLIPMPRQVLELVPATIERSLFSSHPDTVTKEMMKHIHALKVPKNSGKSAQSLRHRFVTIGARRRVQNSLVDTITGHVSDDMKGNQGEANRTARAGVSIHYRYMRGFGPEDLLQAMATIAPIESARDAIMIDEEALLKRSA